MNKEQETAYKQLKDRLATINDLHSAKSLLFWDHQTYMPRGGVPSRAEQVATLSRLAHEMVTDDEMERLLKASGEPDPCSEDGALIRRARRDYERATRLPAELVAETSRVTSLAESAWVRARGESDWSLFAPHLEKVLALKREAAESLGYDDHPYDALLDAYEPGAKKARLEAMFEELKEGVLPLIGATVAKGDGKDRSGPLKGAFGEAGQEEFGREVISAFGYDWERGRQDRSIHPFCINFGPGDVRITTRFDGNWLAPALFGTMHEAGHALYEQGVDPSYARTPLGGGTSMGVHESQSRLWENLVGRSRAFWSHYLPEAAGGVPADLGRYRSRGVLPGDKHTKALRDSGRGRRGHLQPAYPLTLRAGGRLDRGKPLHRRPPRRLERQDGRVPRPRSEERLGGRVAGYPLGGWALRILPNLHHRQRSLCTVLRRGGRGAP